METRREIIILNGLPKDLYSENIRNFKVTRPAPPRVTQREICQIQVLSIACKSLSSFKVQDFNR